MKLVRIAAVALSIVPLLACTPKLTVENADEIAAATLCRQHRSCDTNTWDEANDDRATCEEKVADDVADARDVLDLLGGEIDLEELESCLDDVRAADCEAFGEGSLARVSTIGNDCDDVFTF